MIQEKILRAIEEDYGHAAPGFFVYHDPGRGKYYVCFIDERAKAQMLSKPYTTERNCENALQRFREGQFQADIKEGKEGFFIEFKSEGGKVAARSPFFADRDAAEGMASLIKASEPQPEPAEPTDAGGPPRHSFRLDLYRGEQGEASIRGRIEYSLTQESAAFQGLDMGFVRSFIARRLGQGKGQGSAGGFGSGKIRILQGGAPASGTVISNRQTLEMALDIDIPPDAAYEAFIYAKSLEDNRQALIGRKRGAGGPIRARAFTGSLPPGLYRFTATVHLEGAGEAPEHSDYSLSSPLFHLLPEVEAEMELG